MQINQSRFSHFIVLALSILFLNPPALAKEELDRYEWRKIKDKNNIQVFAKHNDRTWFKSFKSTAVIKLPDGNVLAALMNDYEAMPKWMHFINKVEELDRSSDLDRHMRVVTKLPWPVTDRDATIQILLSQDPETHEANVEFINKPDYIPKKDGYVRFPHLIGRYHLVYLGDDKVEVTYEVVFDPGGWVPAWIANLITKDAAYYTLKRLRKMVLLPKYHNQGVNFISFPIGENQN